MYISSISQMSYPPWYKEGLRFECTRCGICCFGAPGTILVSGAEIKAISGHLGLTPITFLQRYTHEVPGGEISLHEKSNGECIFFNPQKGCTIYKYRPRQCRTWPFWGSVTLTRAHWEKEARRCPGMNQGPRFSAEFIHRVRKQDGTRGAKNII